jgi:hypothetical protein
MYRKTKIINCSEMPMIEEIIMERESNNIDMEQ